MNGSAFGGFASGLAGGIGSTATLMQSKRPADSGATVADVSKTEDTESQDSGTNWGLLASILGGGALGAAAGGGGIESVAGGVLGGALAGKLMDGGLKNSLAGGLLGGAVKDGKMLGGGLPGGLFK